MAVLHYRGFAGCLVGVGEISSLGLKEVVEGLIRGTVQEQLSRGSRVQLQGSSARCASRRDHWIYPPG